MNKISTVSYDAKKNIKKKNKNKNKQKSQQQTYVFTLFVYIIGTVWRPRECCEVS